MSSSSSGDLGVASIKTTIAEDEEQVDEAIKAMMSNPLKRKRLIGLDTFREGTSKRSTPVIQLCDGSQCLIVRMPYLYKPPQSLFNFLSLPCFTFIGFGIKDAMASLKEEYGFVCKNALEAGPCESRTSLNPSVNAVLRTIHIPQTQCISQVWCDYGEITEDSTKLAVSNAHAAFRIGNEILF